MSICLIPEIQPYLRGIRLGSSVYVHCPLITNEEHQKLSKRCGHSSYEDLIDQGFLKDAIVNFVAFLDGARKTARSILSRAGKIFDYHHINKSPAVFDMTKTPLMNGEYMKAMDDEKFYEMALPYIRRQSTVRSISRKLQPW